MKHARDDYNRIQDPDGLIPDDEPVFIIRGQDISAPDALEEWVRLNDLNGGDPKLSELTMKQAAEMRKWHITNKCKRPDLEIKQSREEATELEFLSWFREKVDFGPGHCDVIDCMNGMFEKETGKSVPVGWEQ